MLRATLAASLLLTLASSSDAGVFRFSDDTQEFDPFIVVHPPGYDGMSGGELEVRVCTTAGLERMEPAILEAIEMWNDFSPATGNCTVNCEVWEEPLNPDFSAAPLSMSSVLMHEMGHCIFGVDHTNWPFGGINPGEESSFTQTASATVITVGIDGIRGTSDDEVTPLPGADVIHWFRKSDNNPFILDGMPVDIANYSRRIVDLMSLGDNWSANANRVVGESLGVQETQALMYSVIARGQRFTTISPDDFHTVSFGMSGMDETAGTADDYTVKVVFDGNDCTNADVEIEFSSEVSNPADCLNDIEPLPGGGLFDIHHVTVPFIVERIEIRVNSTTLWDVMFADGFEGGDLSVWDEVVP